MAQIFKDPTGKQLGYIEEFGFDKFKAYDLLETELGTYDPATDKTYDRLGLEIGNGNLLHVLIAQAWQH